MISTGNEAVLESADFLRALVDDPMTKVIAVYWKACATARSSAGRSPPRATPESLSSCSRPARQPRAPSPPRLIRARSPAKDACGTRCCAIAPRSRRSSLEELLDLALQLSGADLARLPPDRGVAAITFGGGSGVLSADQCDRAGLAVPQLAPRRGPRSARDRPAAGVDAEPVDLTPQTYLDPEWLAVFRGARRHRADPASALCSSSSVRCRVATRTRGAIAAFRDRCPKPCSSPGRWRLIEARAGVPRRSMHLFPEYSRGVAQSADSPTTRRICGAARTCGFRDIRLGVRRAGRRAGRSRYRGPVPRLLARAGIAAASGMSRA